MRNIQRVNELRFPRVFNPFSDGVFNKSSEPIKNNSGTYNVKTEDELLVDKYNELLAPYKIKISKSYPVDDEEKIYRLYDDSYSDKKATVPYGEISVFTDVDYVIYKYYIDEQAAPKKRKLNNMDDAIQFVIQRRKDEREKYRQYRREYTQESVVIPFSLFEQGSGDMPACSCGKKKKKEKKQKKMRWSSDVLAEGCGCDKKKKKKNKKWNFIKEEKCGVCGGIKKKRKKSKFIKGSDEILHIN